MKTKNLITRLPAPVRDRVRRAAVRVAAATTESDRELYVPVRADDELLEELTEVVAAEEERGGTAAEECSIADPLELQQGLVDLVYDLAYAHGWVGSTAWRAVLVHGGDSDFAASLDTAETAVRTALEWVQYLAVTTANTPSIPAA